MHCPVRSYGLEEANLMWALGASVLGGDIRVPRGQGLEKFLIRVSWFMHILAFGSLVLASADARTAWGFVLFGLAFRGVRHAASAVRG